jgi:hypothetical protein
MSNETKINAYGNFPTNVFLMPMKTFPFFQLSPLYVMGKNKKHLPILELVTPLNSS